MSDYESNEEESLSNDYTDYSENVCFVISKLWIERQKHINTDYDMTGCMLCVIYHIREYFFNNLKGKHRNQANIVIKNLIADLSEK